LGNQEPDGDAQDEASCAPGALAGLTYVGAHARGFASGAEVTGRRHNDEKIGPMKGVLALRAYQPFPCRIYPPAAAPYRAESNRLDPAAQPMWTRSSEGRNQPTCPSSSPISTNS